MVDFLKSTLAWTLTWDADWVTAVTFLGKSRRIVAGNNIGGMLMWELPEKPGGAAPKPIAQLEGHTNSITRVAATSDGKTLLSSSYDHKVYIWDTTVKPSGETQLTLNARAIEDANRRKANGAKVPPALPATVGTIKPVKTFAAHKEWVMNLELNADDKTVITGDDASSVIVWDRETLAVQKEWKVKGWAYALALSPDRKQACVGERYPVVFDSARHAGLKLWDVTKGEMFKDLSEASKRSYFSAAAYSPDGKVVAAGKGGEIDGTNGKVMLFDPKDGKLLKELTPGHLNGITDICFHPDGKHLASTGRDTVIRIWSIPDGKMIAEVGKSRGGQFKDWLHAIRFSADGNWLIAADMAGAVQVWSFAN